jgi:DNA-directed RNA polymerase specialized sigma24 family protein
MSAARDYAQPEMAGRLDIPEGTGKVRLRGGRQRLETLIETR